MAPRQRRDPAPPHAGSGRAARALTRAALGTCALLALWAHARFVAHAGGFWRDEANTLAFAALPSLGDVFALLGRDSAPPAAVLLVRAALAAGLESDRALRAVGAGVGLATLAVLLAAARSLGAPLPLATLALFALNAWVIRGGDALRPQGVAMLGVALAAWAAARAVLAPGRRTYLALGAASAFATACAWTGLPLLGALASALILVAARERRREVALGALAIVVGGGLAMAPVVPAVLAAREWGVLVRTGTRLGQALDALGPHAWDRAAWLAAALLAVAVGARAFARRAASDGERRRRALATFALVAMVAGVAGTLALLQWSDLPTQPWYYLPAMTLVAFSLDLLLAPLAGSPRARALVPLALLALLPWQAWRAAGPLTERATNVDLLAARLAQVAGAGDLVVVTPWQLGVAYARVAPAAVPWTTLPPLADSRVHRYDLVQQAMLSPGVATRVNERALATLAGGGRVFVLGGLPPMRSGEAAPLPPAAPTAALGWNSDAYTLLWARHFAASVVPHLAGARAITVDAGPVSRFEDVELLVLEGAAR